MEKEIINMQNSLFKEMSSEMISFTNNLTNNSYALLDFKRLKIKETLKDLKKKIFILTSNFEANEKIKNTISRIDDAILTIIDIQSRIEGYVQQNEFANYMSAITKDEDTLFIPTEYAEQIKELKKSIQKNIIEERFQQALDAFKYWSFPSHCDYTQNITVNGHESIEDKIKNYALNLDTLLDHVKKDKAELRPSLDNHIVHKLFDEKIPFFEWTSKKYPFELKRLLSGQSTYARFDVIKFYNLYLQFEIDESNLNKTLNELLKEFYIEMTHSGESNYKFKEKSYRIDMDYKSKEKLLLKYQYGDNNNANTSYKKLESSRPVLSPYTLWLIKIKAVKKEKEEELLKKIDMLIHGEIKIKLSLCGKGQYIDSSKENTCENYF